MLMLPLKSTVLERDLGRQVAGLFGAGEQGGWYDVADMSTLFQDSAGATPVTAVEQQVGRMLDKSGRGNHATQATTTKRPVLSRRYNLLRKTEQFDDVMWEKSGGANIASITPNTDTAPDGTLTADTLVLEASLSYVVESLANMPSFVGQAVCLRVFTKSAARILFVGGATAAGSDVYTITSLQNGWYLQQVVRTFSVAASSSWQIILSGATAGLGSYVIWGASLTLATDAHLPYQWVNTATDYDADPSKFPAYLRWDGVDDAMQTGNIDFTGTDKMTVWAGITNLAGGTSELYGLSTNPTSNPAVMLRPTGGGGASGDIGAYSRGSGPFAAAYIVGAGNPPATLLTTAESSISDPYVRLRINGALREQNTLNQGAGNYGNYPLYIGARGGTSYYFNGRLYGLLVRGAQSTLSQIEATEAYIKQKMRLP